MRQCLLHAGLSHAVGAEPFVLGNPKAWLGTAYHAVLERVAATCLATEQLDAVVTSWWDAAIAVALERAETHPLDRRFGQPETWPGYHLALAAVRLRARELAACAEAPASPEADNQPAVHREHLLTAYGGKLAGRPDVIRGSEIVDYKTGSISDDEEPEGLKQAYVRQLRVYGYLVQQALGTLPRRGTVLPLVGSAVSIDLDPAECEREAAEAVSLLDSFNASLHDTDGLGSPSPTHCRWCGYKLICSGFWQAVSPAWSGQLGSEAIEGTLADRPRSIYSGTAISIVIDSSRGTRPPGRHELAPLSVAVHGALSDVHHGEHVRVVGLRLDHGSRLRPGPRTIVARTADLPGLDSSATE